MKKPNVKVKVATSTCTLYCSWRSMRCPLCGVDVPKATEHRCEKKS